MINACFAASSTRSATRALPKEPGADRTFAARGARSATRALPKEPGANRAQRLTVDTNGAGAQCVATWRGELYPVCRRHCVDTASSVLTHRGQSADVPTALTNVKDEMKVSVTG